MAELRIEAVDEAALPEFCEFLHQHLNASRSAAEWEKALRVDWGAARPNFGYIMRDAGRVVGGIGAIYASRPIAGREERFCNITSWCVLDEYRKQSMRLAMCVIKQPGFHFTDFSPTAVVGGVLRFLKFRPIDEREVVVLNLPAPLAAGRVISDPARIVSTLTEDALRIYNDHASFPWLRHALVGDDGHWCHVVYKARSFKGLPSAHLIHVGDPEVLARHLRRFCSYLLMRGFASTHVEARRLRNIPWLSRIRSGFNPKLFLSVSLAEESIDYLYSETVAMDLE